MKELYLMYTVFVALEYSPFNKAYSNDSFSSKYNELNNVPTLQYN